jgi:hypothetical protein
MRKIIIREDNLVRDDGTNDEVSCWCKDDYCTTDCAAFAKMIVMKPDRTQDLVGICAAIPQQIPIGVLEEGKVAMPTGPVPTLVRG